jgi:dihydrofolate reductase
MRKYEISLIVAHSKNLVIGKGNSLPWKLKDDLSWFKSITQNKPIIMGSKTFESIGRKPLPNRINVVLTKNIFGIDNDFGELNYSEFNNNQFGSFSVRKYEKFKISTATSLESALDYFDVMDTRHNEIFIIGGSKLYNYSIDIVDNIYRSVVDCTIDGDAYFPEINEDDWEKQIINSFEKNERNEFSFEVQKLTRKKHILSSIIS